MKKIIFICFLRGFCLLILIGIGSNSSAKSKVDRSPERGAKWEYPTSSDSLNIGDRLPPGIEFSSLINSSNDKLRLEEFRGKYLILQFWAPSCSGSIASLSKIDQLVAKYSDQIEVIPITTFSEEPVQKVFNTYSSLEELKMPILVNAQQIREFFPHSTIPHFVILDREGVVIAITGQEDITPENLDLMLAGKEPYFRYKVDKAIKLGRYDRLISESPQVANKNIWYQSALTGYIPDVGGSLIQEFEDLSHIRIVNLPLINFYKLAYSQRDLVDYFGKNRIITIGFEEEELFTDKSGADYVAWKEAGNHVFGYELLAPPSKNPYSLMREDLKRYFPNISASVRKEKRRVYALVQQKGTKFPKAMAGKSSYKADPFGVAMRNYPLQGFIYHLNTYFFQASPYPIVNLTGIDYPIDLDLKVALADPEKLREALYKVGLDLIEREEEINVLVLEKNGETNLLAL
ncbi:MAG: TlpA disulfide reductase family protein [Algoriphagus sp.]|jgi:thiol-disulfide isomerase/thioredoxin|uniref:TlpA family protein disulfide reductase n=1 Tax=Algoriphagus sp. TaxID=1872435 RepID=UPI00261FB0C4|nr:TlpA disulfide reductase family protein [Algoriphagus sp.]MDG1277539.1 TlpA disulfide reductase family protein [Algoriphagus sp.]